MLPSLVHTHHNRYLEDLPFWLGLAEQTGGPILELGCGTGRVLKPLIEAGYCAIGLDHDLSMLKFLRADIGSHNLSNSSVIATDITRFNLATRFPLIILPCNTFSTLDTDQRQACLACVSRHLKPDGVFAVSVPNPVILSVLPARSAPQLEDEFIHPQTGNPVQVSSSWSRTKYAFRITWVYDHLLPDGRVEHVVTRINHQLITLETYLTEFEEAGLLVGEIYGDYDRTAYDETTPYLIITATTPSH